MVEQRRCQRFLPILSSAIVHHQFETIHPFADGNGRAGRMLSLWELYRRGFDNHHIFSIDEFYWEDRPRLLCRLGKSAAATRRSHQLARILRGRVARNAGASLEPDSKANRPRGQSETGASPETGATPASITRTQGTDAAGTLGRSRRIKTRRARFIATTDQSWLGAADWNEKDRPLHLNMKIDNGSRSDI